MKKRSVFHSLVLASVVVLTTGCAATSLTTSGTVVTDQAASATVPTLGLSPQALQSGPTEPVWDQESKDSARRAAVAVMKLFARPGLSAATWADDLAALMTPKAITDFYGTDPARIPAHHITGKPSLTVDPSNGFSVLATIATDAGPYRIQLLRTMTGAPWKANMITPELVTRNARVESRTDMDGKKTPFRDPDTSDNPPVAATTPPPAVGLTGPSKPLLSVPRPGPAGRLPERKAVSALPQFWWLGVHGGSGETSLAQATNGTKAAEHHWPISSKPVRVVLVCRSNITGLQAAQRAATEWASGSRTNTSVLGLVVVADAPGRLPAKIRDFARIVGGGVPHLWTLPWIEQWRLSHDVPTEELPRTVCTVLDQVRLSASSIPAGTPGEIEIRKRNR